MSESNQDFLSQGLREATIATSNNSRFKSSIALYQGMIGYARAEPNISLGI